jgi:3-dehydro-L-gulonate 2-dehydrogenase
MRDLLGKILLREGFSSGKAALIAGVHTRSSCDGVASHGLNRFPLFIEYVRTGLVDPAAEPACINRSGFMEQWDGRLGAGVWNAHKAMKRCTELAEELGMGLVALRNTNHWMRGGTYGWQAADAGFIAVCFTNTKPNMPAWGASDLRTGNNPLVISLPRKKGHVVLDMSMSQFSYGVMQRYLSEGKKLPVPGGWDEHGHLTDEPGSILGTGRVLPIGYWKGSALSVVLDLLAVVLSGGLSTAQVGGQKGETALSQVFLCLKPDLFAPEQERNAWMDDLIGHLHGSEPVSAGARVRYPGERIWETRIRNLRDGIPVDPDIWASVQRLLD